MFFYAILFLFICRSYYQQGVLFLGKSFFLQFETFHVNLFKCFVNFDTLLYRYITIQKSIDIKSQVHDRTMRTCTHKLLKNLSYCLAVNSKVCSSMLCLSTSSEHSDILIISCQKPKAMVRRLLNAFRTCVRSSHFYINLKITFIHKDIYSKFAGNVYGHACPKFWPHFEKQNGHYSQLFKIHKDALNLETLQLALSNLHKRYMARKASLVVILA